MSVHKESNQNFTWIFLSKNIVKLSHKTDTLQKSKWQFVFLKVTKLEF